MTSNLCRPTILITCSLCTIQVAAEQYFREIFKIWLIVQILASLLISWVITKDF